MNNTVTEEIRNVKKESEQRKKIKWLKPYMKDIRQALEDDVSHRSILEMLNTVGFNFTEKYYHLALARLRAKERDVVARSRRHLRVADLFNTRVCDRNSYCSCDTSELSCFAASPGPS